MGFQGYINSDTGIVHNMAWGVEMLDKAERIGFAVNHAGVDLISGMVDVPLAKEAYERADNDYYATHPLPEGFTREMVTLSEEALDRAVSRTLTSLFELGVFENPYRDPKQAVEVVENPDDWERAAEAHRKSVVLLKNDGTLPLASGRKIYAEAFAKQPETAQKATEELRKLLQNENLVDDPSDADYAILMINPSSGAYFSATPGFLELDICEEKRVHNVDDEDVRLTRHIWRRPCRGWQNSADSGTGSQKSWKGDRKCQYYAGMADGKCGTVCGCTDCGI